MNSSLHKGYLICIELSVFFSVCNEKRIKTGIKSSVSFLKPFSKSGITICFLPEFNTFSYLPITKKKKVMGQTRAKYSLQPATNAEHPRAGGNTPPHSGCHPPDL